MKIAYCPEFAYPLPEGHVFPMAKYRLLPERLIEFGIVDQEEFFRPKPVDSRLLEAVHCAEYIGRLSNLDLTVKEMRKTGFPLCENIMKREWLVTGGTVDGSLLALEEGVAGSIAGGTHHAFYDHGEGYCLLNDQVVAAQNLIDIKLAKKVLIIDLDVHQGNGTAALCAGRKDIFSLSLHAAKSYPTRKQKSDLDVALPTDCGDEEYLATLEATLQEVSSQFEADFVFYQAGVDVLADDRLGHLSLSLDGCMKRDEMIFDFCKEHDLPVFVTVGGGYSENLETILKAHCNTFTAAKALLVP